jgi:hypothetical protein
MSCSASGNSDGTCKRTCGNRPIGGGRLKVYAVSAAEKWECSTDNIPERTFRFKVVEETSSASKEKFDPTKDIPKTIPVAGIDFAPEGVPEGTFNTDSSELCTDSCGYATMKFTPTCMTQDLAVSITVPGADLDGTTTAPTIQFTVTKK